MCYWKTTLWSRTLLNKMSFVYNIGGRRHPGEPGLGSRAIITKYHQVYGLHNRNVLSLSYGGYTSKIKKVSEVGSFWKQWGKICVPGPSPLGLLVCWHFFQVLEVSPQSLPFFLHGVLPVCMVVSKFPLFIKTSVLLDQGPILLYAVWPCLN